jgi:hypothetical protein
MDDNSGKYWDLIGVLLNYAYINQEQLLGTFYR